MTFVRRSSFRGLALTATLLAACALAACGGGDSSAPRLQLSLSGLESLGDQAVYEGWIITANGPVSTGRFTVDGAGKLSQTEFALTSAQADAAKTFVLTIEPAVNDVPTPADSHLLAGDFDAAKTTANVSISHAAALGTDFKTAMGRYFLATPSTTDASDDDQGIWFMANGAPGLTLPTLPTGWVYEGWVVVGGVPRSTGRFTNPAIADSDGAGPTAGPNAGPNVPGQDYINPAVHLPGGMAVISVEPAVDNSPAPFTLKPLVGVIGTGVGPSNLNTLGNTLGDGSKLPRGSVSIVR